MSRKAFNEGMGLTGMWVSDCVEAWVAYLGLWSMLFGCVVQTSYSSQMP
jgi:hypothetical protein